MAHVVLGKEEGSRQAEQEGVRGQADVALLWPKEAEVEDLRRDEGERRPGASVRCALTAARSGPTVAGGVAQWLTVT